MVKSPRSRSLCAIQVVPDLGRPRDSHWVRFTESHAILEIKLWVLETEEERKRDMMIGMSSPNPVCQVRGIPMRIH